jgi:hypothetical protein
MVIGTAMIWQSATQGAQSVHADRWMHAIRSNESIKFRPCSERRR